MSDTAKASPRPWRAMYTRILDARGKSVCVCEKDSMHGRADDETAKADAALIVDAVNLKTRIDEAMADESGYLHPVVLDGKPMVCVTPPPSEAEESRMHREYETSLLADRERFRRCYYEATERNARLRDIVSRLADTLQSIIDAAEGRGVGRLDEGLVREAREAIEKEMEAANV